MMDLGTYELHGMCVFVTSFLLYTSSMICNRDILMVS